MAFHVKSGLFVTVLNAVSRPHSFEFIALKMYLPCNIAIIVVGVYRPPSAISSTADNLADLLAQCCNSEILFLGDF